MRQQRIENRTREPGRLAQRFCHPLLIFGFAERRNRANDGAWRLTADEARDRKRRPNSNTGWLETVCQSNPGNWFRMRVSITVCLYAMISRIGSPKSISSRLWPGISNLR